MYLSYNQPYWFVPKKKKIATVFIIILCCSWCNFSYGCLFRLFYPVTEIELYDYYFLKLSIIIKYNRLIEIGLIV